MFVAAVSEFDQVIEEDGFTNSLEESLQLFETISASDFFKTTPLVLFLNKKDILVEKISEGIKFSRYFPDYSGKEGDYNSIINYISDEFMDRKTKNEHDYEERPLNIHQTCAPDGPNRFPLANNVPKGAPNRPGPGPTMRTNSTSIKSWIFAHIILPY